MRKRRWPRRVAEAMSRWLHREPGLHAAPATPYSKPAPPEPEPLGSETEGAAPEIAPAPTREQPEPEVVPQPDPEGGPEPMEPASLIAALDSLGQAHHRPFSRA